MSVKIYASQDYVQEELMGKITAPSEAFVGQALIVKSVNENGKPTEWEVADMVRGIPDYTSADEGKFLRIVNGVPAWVSIPNAEEANF